MALPTEYSEDWGFNALGPELGIALVDPYNELPNSPMSLLALAPGRGLFAAAGGADVVVGKLADLRAALKSDAPVENKTTIALAEPRFVTFSASEKQLFVYSADRRVSAYSTQTWSQVFSCEPLEAPVLALESFKTRQGVVLASTAGVSSIDEHGVISTVTTDTVFCLSINDEIITPGNLDLSSIESSIGKVLSLNWLARDWLLLVAEKADDAEEYITFMRNSDLTWVEIEDACAPSNLDAPFMWFQGAIGQWPTTDTAFTDVAVSSQSTELLLLSSSNVWKPMNETDNLPFTTADEDVVSVGGALDLTDTTLVPSLKGIEGEYAFPLWLILTQEGRILGWHVVCRDASTPNAAAPAAPTLVDVPDLARIHSSTTTEKDIADEELEEISESDVRDSGKSDPTDGTETESNTPSDKLRPKSTKPDEQQLIANSSLFNGLPITGSGDELTPTQETTQKEHADPDPVPEADIRPAPELKSPEQRQASDSQNAKFAFGSFSGPDKGFAAWSKGGSKDSPFSRFAAAGANSTSPFREKIDSFSSRKAESQFSSGTSLFGTREGSLTGNPSFAPASEITMASSSNPTSLPHNKEFPGNRGDGFGKTADSFKGAGFAGLSSSDAKDSNQGEKPLFGVKHEPQEMSRGDTKEKPAYETTAEADANKAEADAKLREEAQAQAERKARADAESKAAAVRAAEAKALKIEGTSWPDKREDSLIQPSAYIDEALIAGLTDMDSVYAQTNMFLQVLDHNLSVLERFSYEPVSTKDREFRDLSQWGVGDALELRHKTDALFKDRTADVKESTENCLRTISDTCIAASQALSDLAMLQSKYNDVSVSESDKAYRLSPLPPHSAQSRHEILSTLGRVWRLIGEAKAATLVKRAEFGETIEFSNILAATESIDVRLHVLESVLDPPIRSSRHRDMCSSHRDASGPFGDSYAASDATHREIDDKLVGNVIASATTRLGRVFPPTSGAPLNESAQSTQMQQAKSVRSLLKSLKERDSESLITTVHL